MINITTFDSLVGLEQIGVSADYVNTVTGMTDDLILACALDEAGDVVKLWADVRREALEKVELELMGCLSSKADYKEVIAKSLSPGYSAVTDVYSSATTQTGVSINVIGAESIKLIISKVSLICDTAFTGIVKIHNLDTGVELKTENVAFTKGHNTKAFSFETSIGFGNSSFFVSIMLPSGVELKSIGVGSSSEFVAVNAVSCLVIADKTTDNMVEANPYLHVEYALKYDFVNIIVENVDTLKLAYKYFCGYFLFERAKRSTHANKVTLVNRKYSLDDSSISTLKDAFSAIDISSGIIYKAIKDKNIPVLDTPKVARELFMTVSGV